MSKIDPAEALRRMTNPETDPGATKLSKYVDPTQVSDGQNVTSAANPNPIPSEDVHSQVANPTNQSGDVGIPNQPKENNDPISRYQKYVEGIQRPDLSSLLTGYDQQTNQAANDVKKAESNRKWAALADLGNLVGGYIGARGGANVNVNPQNNEGVYNQAINKLSNTYRQYQSGRPDLVAKLALQKYNEQMQTAGGLYKGAVLSDKEKQDQFNQDYKLADLNQKIAAENNRFTHEQKSDATAAQREKDQAEHNKILESLTGQRNNLYGGYLSNMDRRTQDAENAKKAPIVIGDTKVNKDDAPMVALRAYQAYLAANKATPTPIFTINGGVPVPTANPTPLQILQFVQTHANYPSISGVLNAYKPKSQSTKSGVDFNKYQKKSNDSNDPFSNSGVNQ